MLLDRQSDEMLSLGYDITRILFYLSPQREQICLQISPS
ncbi:hypothetical protein PLUTE_a0902 [Pseudoalteromonas luteoviolacea DSM 6061]|nr:hypothetical protein [Pseudoalteromonas luteoviolacea DSM 6061]